MDKEFKKYEIGFVAKDEKSGDDINKLLVIHKCEIMESGALDRIKLAYPIKKENVGYFGYFHFLIEPLAIEKIKSELNLNPNILRFIIITPPAERRPVSAIKTEIRRKTFVSKDIEPKVEIRKPSAPSMVLTNEALEKKLEEILK
ncbi:MAG: 30S ribosomal protein S6 [Patescibacteria group bacterium]